MKFLVLMISILSLSTANAGDKVGNGGGLWACISPTQQLLKGTLVDLYEARTEFGLTTITSIENNPMNIVKERENYLRTNSSRYLRDWSLALSEVLGKMRLVDAELEKVDDALFRMRPLPTSCAGTWNYVQFANFTHLNQVLVRQDLWNDPTIPALDKAALIWHETIYKWLRETYGDKDSVRARQIVGLIFAQISSSDLESGIADVLRQTNPGNPPPAPAPIPVTSWICMTRNGATFKYFGGYGFNEIAARGSLMNTCQSDGMGYNCVESQIRCDSFDETANLSHACTLVNNYTRVTHTAQGRSLLEAELKVRQDCQKTSDAVHCSFPASCQ